MFRKGDVAPEFALMDQDGNLVESSQFRGTTYLLYFYPKDDTPGCTKEACNFRDDYTQYQEAGIRIVGVSPDSPESHKKFKEKYNLPFTLLADEDHVVAEAYGVWGKKKSFGREYYGILRTTFLIDGSGRFQEIFKGVKPASHSAEILGLINKD
jgi:peroxiredoxin Q/BCP